MPTAANIDTSQMYKLVVISQLPTSAENLLFCERNDWRV